MTRVTLVCRTCGAKARRDLMNEPGSRGTHETASEEAWCPEGHGRMERCDRGGVTIRGMLHKEPV